MQLSLCNFCIVGIIIKGINARATGTNGHATIATSNFTYIKATYAKLFEKQRTAIEPRQDNEPRRYEKI